MIAAEAEGWAGGDSGSGFRGAADLQRRLPGVSSEPMQTVLLVIVLLLLLGALPAWPYSTGWGYYPSGGLGLLLIILLILALTRRR